VLDLSTAVKELLENALDADATNVEIRLIKYGSVMVEVSDNGSGIDKKDFENLTAKHYTSKISKFEDLETVHSFGFRGEALSSLCALSTLSVVTKTKNDTIGTSLMYDHEGRITSQKGVARNVRVQ
jgi:DNA mismatch repair protein PMS2